MKTGEITPPTRPEWLDSLLGERNAAWDAFCAACDKTPRDRAEIDHLSQAWLDACEAYHSAFDRWSIDPAACDKDGKMYYRKGVE